MPEATGSINRSNTICHYTRFFRFLESNCNGCNVGDPKMVELLHLFAEDGLSPSLSRMRGPALRVLNPRRLPTTIGADAVCPSLFLWTATRSRRNRSFK